MEFDFSHAPIPAYPGGAQRLFPVGGGLADDKLGDFGDAGVLLRADETDEASFRAYLKTLQAHGYALTWEREDGGGIYAEAVKDETLLYLYYIVAERTARVILDRASSPLAAFTAGDPAPGRADAAIMQFGLSYGPMVKGVTCDCGMFYAVRLPNNELILVDGGEAEQATDAAIREAMARLQALTGQETVTVALWFCTHAHDDHMDFFAKLLRVYRERIVLRRVMFNFPSAACIRLAPYVSRLRARLAEAPGQISFLKCHAGQRFSLGGAELSVLLTHEDVLGDYPDKAYRGMNETSTVLMVRVLGVSLLVIGDIEEHNGDLLRRRYGKEDLACTFLQAAHHCINRVENVYAWVPAERVLIPEGSANIRRGPEDPYGVIRRYHPAEAVLPADETLVFTVRNGAISETAFPTVGGAYDGTGV